MTRPVTDLPTTDTALVLCDIAETMMVAALARMLKAPKDQKKEATKALNAARNEYHMALVKFYKTFKREKGGGS